MTRLSCLKRLTAAVFFVLTFLLCIVHTSVAIDIPPQYGSVTRRGEYNSSKFVVHIQDAHFSFDAQKNVANIICALLSQIDSDQKPFIGVEGAVGEYGLTKLRHYPVKQAKESIGRQFVLEGKFTGPELASILSDSDFLLYGLEDRQLLIKNFNAFYNASTENARLLSELEPITHAVNSLKQALFNEQLYQFDTHICDFERRHIDVSAYVEFLYPYAESLGCDPADYPALQQYQSLSLMKQSIDFDCVERDITLLVTALTQGAHQSDRVREAVIDYNISKITQHTLLHILTQTATDANIDLSAYGSITTLTDYYRQYNELDFSALMCDISRLHASIRDSVILSDTEKKIIAISDKLALITRLLTLKATEEDIALFRQNSESYSLTKLVDEIQHIAPETVQIDLPETDSESFVCALRYAERFYETAEQRNEIMIDNLLDKMDESGQHIGVIVAGGYHSAAIEQMLAEQGISFMTVRPRIEDTTKTVAYMNRMTGNIIPLDAVFTGSLQASRLTVSLHALNAMGFERLVNDAYDRMSHASLRILTRESAALIAKALLSERGIDLSVMQLNEIPQDDRQAWLIGQALKQIALELYTDGMLSELVEQVHNGSINIYQLPVLLIDEIERKLTEQTPAEWGNAVTQEHGLQQFLQLNKNLFVEQLLNANGARTVVRNMLLEMNLSYDESDIDRLLAVLNYSLQDGVPLVIYCEDENGNHSKTYVIRRTPDDSIEYVQWRRPFEDSMPAFEAVRIIHTADNAIEAIQEITYGAHQVLGDYELISAYRDPSRVQPVPHERIDAVITKLNRLGDHGKQLAQKLNTLSTSNVSPDGIPLSNRINIVDGISRSHAGGMGITLQGYDGITDAHTEDLLLHEVIAGSFFGHDILDDIHEFANRIVALVHDEEYAEAAQLLSERTIGLNGFAVWELPDLQRKILYRDFAATDDGWTPPFRVRKLEPGQQDPKQARTRTPISFRPVERDPSHPQSIAPADLLQMPWEKLDTIKFNISFSGELADTPEIDREQLSGTINYAIRCLFHAANSNALVNRARLADFLQIISPRAIAFYGDPRRAYAAFEQKLSMFRRNFSYTSLEAFPPVQISIVPHMLEDYIEPNREFPEGLLPVVASVERRSDRVIISVPSIEALKRLSYHHYMMLISYAYAHSDASSYKFADLEPEGLYDPAMTCLAMHVWEIGPLHQNRNFTDKMQDSIVSNITITSTGSIDDTERRNEREKILAILKELLVPPNDWPWELYYNYVLATLQGRNSARNPLSIEIYDASSRPDLSGSSAFLNITENKIYINRHSLIIHGDEARKVQVVEFFTTDQLKRVILEELFHADADILRAKQNATQASTAVQATLPQLSDTMTIETRKEITRQAAILALQQNAVRIRQQLRFRAIQRLMQGRFKEKFNGRILIDKRGTPDIEHTNLLNLINEYFYRKALRHMQPATAKQYADALASPCRWVNVEYSKSIKQDGIESLIIFNGQVLGATIHISPGDPGYFALHSRKEGEEAQCIGSVRTNRDNGTTQFFFSFEPGFELLRLSSEVLTASLNSILLNNPQLDAADICVHIDDLPAEGIPYAIIHRDGGKQIQKIHAQAVPQSWRQRMAAEQAADSRVAFRIRHEELRDYEQSFSIPVGDRIIQIARILVDNDEQRATQLAQRIVRILDTITLIPDIEHSYERAEIDRLRAAAQNIKNVLFAVSHRPLGSSTDIETVRVSKTSVTFFFDKDKQPDRLLAQLNDTDTGFLFMNLLLRGESITWPMDFIKHHITSNSLITALTELLFPAARQIPQEQPSAPHVTSRHPHIIKGHYIDIPIQILQAPWSNAINAARLWSTGILMFGNLSANNFTPLPEPQQSELLSLLGPALLTHDTVKPFLSNAPFSPGLDPQQCLVYHTGMTMSGVRGEVVALVSRNAEIEFGTLNDNYYIPFAPRVQDTIRAQQATAIRSHPDVIAFVRTQQTPVVSERTLIIDTNFSVQNMEHMAVRVHTNGLLEFGKRQDGVFIPYPSTLQPALRQQLATTINLRSDVRRFLSEALHIVGRYERTPDAFNDLSAAIENSQKIVEYDVDAEQLVSELSAEYNRYRPGIDAVMEAVAAQRDKFPAPLPYNRISIHVLDETLYPHRYVEIGGVKDYARRLPAENLDTLELYVTRQKFDEWFAQAHADATGALNIGKSKSVAEILHELFDDGDHTQAWNSVRALPQDTQRNIDMRLGADQSIIDMFEDLVRADIDVIINEFDQERRPDWQPEGFENKTVDYFRFLMQSAGDMELLRQLTGTMYDHLLRYAIGHTHNVMRASYIAATAQYPHLKSGSPYPEAGADAVFLLDDVLQEQTVLNSYELYHLRTVIEEYGFTVMLMSELTNALKATLQTKKIYYIGTATRDIAQLEQDFERFVSWYDLADQSGTARHIGLLAFRLGLITMLGADEAGTHKQVAIQSVFDMTQYDQEQQRVISGLAAILRYRYGSQQIDTPIVAESGLDDRTSPNRISDAINRSLQTSRSVEQSL